MTRRSPLSAIVLLGLACFVLFVTSLQAACTKAQRQDTLRASLLSVNAARDSFVAWDLAHQQGLVDRATTREEATQAVSEYRVTQGKVTEWFATAYQALAVAATQSDDASFTQAVDAVRELLRDLQQVIGSK